VAAGVPLTDDAQPAPACLLRLAIETDWGLAAIMTIARRFSQGSGEEGIVTGMATGFESNRGRLCHATRNDA
jgi:hypothetical protein